VPQNCTQLAGVLATRYVQFDCNRYFREGWVFFRMNACFFTCWLILFAVIGIAVYVGVAALFHATGWGHSESGWMWAELLREVLFNVLYLAPAVVGWYAAIFEALRLNSFMKGRTLFTGYSCPYFFRLLGLTVVMTCVGRALTMLFVLPGIYFFVVTAFSFPLHVDNKHMRLRACQAIILSAKTIMRYCCQFLGFALLCGLMNIAGLLLFGVGLLISVPITAGAMAACYHHLVGINGMAVLMPREAALQNVQVIQVVAAQPPQAQPSTVPVPVMQLPPVN